MNPVKLHYSAASPFVRKVMICAIELGLDGKIERLAAAAHPVNRDGSIIANNPLGQVPTFFADDGTVLYDSRVICEYLDTIGGGSLFPKTGAARWQALVEQSLADGLLDAALLVRYERIARPETLKWEGWEGGQLDKIRCALDKLDADAAGFGARLDIGTITIACALGYLDFRFPELAWRQGRDALAKWFEAISSRPSLKATVPQG
jgi:glutathione S-transferase